MNITVTIIVVIVIHIIMIVVIVMINHGHYYYSCHYDSRVITISAACSSLPSASRLGKGWRSACGSLWPRQLWHTGLRRSLSRGGRVSLEWWFAAVTCEDPTIMRQSLSDYRRRAEQLVWAWAAHLQQQAGKTFEHLRSLLCKLSLHNLICDAVNKPAWQDKACITTHT